MADSENNIPTLTNIAQPGNEAMLNHFDAHQFDEAETEPAFATENASAPENTTTIENSELDDMPSIKTGNDDSSDIESLDFSADMQSVAETIPEEKPETLEVDADRIKEKIDQAIADALPGIEVHLKEQLYRRFEV